jgi:hypothetical protein
MPKLIAEGTAPAAEPAATPANHQQARRARLRAEFPEDTAEDTEKRASQEEQEDEKRIEQAGCGFAAILLYRLGLMTAEEVAADQSKSNLLYTSAAETLLDLTPPITAKKITNALAAVTTKLASGELDPKKGTAMLYAIQNLTAAHHAQIEQEKWEARQRRTPNAQETPPAEIHGRGEMLLQEVRKTDHAPGQRRADRLLHGVRGETAAGGRKPKASRRAGKPRARRRRKP